MDDDIGCEFQWEDTTTGLWDALESRFGILHMYTLLKKPCLPTKYIVVSKISFAKFKLPTKFFSHREYSFFMFVGNKVG